MAFDRFKTLALLLLPALTGILGFASFPKLNYSYLTWIAFVPLLVFLIASPGIGRAFTGGMIAGSVQFFLMLAWIPAVLAHYGGIPLALGWGLYALLMLTLSLFPATAVVLTRYCMNLAGDRFLLVFPFAWVLAEYARGCLVFGGFPWLLTGYSQTDHLRLIQVADITGVYGVSFLIAWVNVAFVWVGLRLTRSNTTIWPVTAGFLLVVCCFGYGEASLRYWSQVKPDHTTALLQENISADEPESVLAGKVQQGYIRMADLLNRIPIDLLVLPESPSPLPFQHDAAYREALRQLARRYSLGMVFNNIADVKQGNATRYFNSAYFLDREGRELARYDKIHLVPFGEYIPWRRFFFFAETITRDVEDFSAGTQNTVVSLEGHPVNAIICFEAVFPELARQFVRDGSQLIINLTNDAWYGNSAAPYQHLAMARWRAIENRRYLLRAANSGVSAIIRPTGGLQAVTGLFREEICVGLFAFSAHQTIYTRYGDMFVMACAIIMCLLVILCFRWSASKRLAG